MTATKTAEAVSTKKPASTVTVAQGTATRAPSKKPTARAKKAPRVAMFIDLDSSGAKAINIKEVISIVKGMGDFVCGKLYGVGDERVTEFAELVQEHKLVTMGLQRIRGGVDTRLVIDVVTMATTKSFDKVFVWTGGDMISLFAQLQGLGIETITADLPSIDCKNKFVTTAVTLYSALGMNLGGSAPFTPPPVSAPQYAPAMPQYMPQFVVAAPQYATQYVAPVQPANAAAAPAAQSQNTAAPAAETAHDDHPTGDYTPPPEVDITKEPVPHADDDEPEMSDEEYMKHMERMALEGLFRGRAIVRGEVKEDDDEAEAMPGAPTEPGLSEDYGNEEDKPIKSDYVPERDDSTDGFTDFGDDFGSIGKK